MYCMKINDQREYRLLDILYVFTLVYHVHPSMSMHSFECAQMLAHMANDCPSVHIYMGK